MCSALQSFYCGDLLFLICRLYLLLGAFTQKLLCDTLAASRRAQRWFPCWTRSWMMLQWRCQPPTPSIFSIPVIISSITRSASLPSSTRKHLWYWWIDQLERGFWDRFYNWVNNGKHRYCHRWGRIWKMRLSAKKAYHYYQSRYRGLGQWSSTKSWIWFWIQHNKPTYWIQNHNWMDLLINCQMSQNCLVFVESLKGLSSEIGYLEGNITTVQEDSMIFWMCFGNGNRDLNHRFVEDIEIVEHAFDIFPNMVETFVDETIDEPWGCWWRDS